MFLVRRKMTDTQKLTEDEEAVGSWYCAMANSASIRPEEGWDRISNERKRYYIERARKEGYFGANRPAHI
jgi:hypothetical protein